MSSKNNLPTFFFTFALMTTGTFSQNVGKLFYELKLVTNNLLSIGKIMGRKKLAYKDTEPGLRATILKIPIM